MAQEKPMPALLERLPPVRGRLTPGAALSAITWFRVGGPAEVLFRPADREDLLAFLAAKPAEVPVTVIGVGSNLLVRDGGVPGVVLRLARGFAEILVEGEEVEAGAAALDVNVAKVAADAGLGGLEFLVGVPGTIGGAVRMNAGAYGSELKHVVVWVEAADAGGRVHRLTPGELNLGYRSSGLPPDWIVLKARLRGRPDELSGIQARMAAITAQRGASQPVRSRTGGSTFANPPGARAWELIDAAGCRGLRIGGAQVSELHCNFLINTGSATAADLEALGEEVRRRVKRVTGIELRWEIKIIGVPGAAP